MLKKETSSIVYADLQTSVDSWCKYRENEVSVNKKHRFCCTCLWCRPGACGNAPMTTKNGLGPVHWVTRCGAILYLNVIVTVGIMLLLWRWRVFNQEYCISKLSLILTCKISKMFVPSWKLTECVAYFFRGCDNCNEWYHGDCIGMTPQESNYIKIFFCGICRSTLN